MAKYRVELQDFNGVFHYMLVAPARWTSLFAIDVPDELVEEYNKVQEKLRNELEETARMPHS